MKGLLEQCLKDVIEQSDGAHDLRFIVADNSTDDKFRIDAEFEAKFPNLEVLHLTENRGWVDALNHLLANEEQTRTAERQSGKAAERQSGKAAERQNGRVAEPKDQQTNQRKTNIRSTKHQAPSTGKSGRRAEEQKPRTNRPKDQNTNHKAQHTNHEPKTTNHYTIIMHPDVRIERDTLGTLAEFLQQHPDAAVVSPDLVYPDNRPCTIRTRFPTLCSELKQLCNVFTQVLLKRKFFVDEVLWDHHGTIPVDMVMSVFMCWRTTDLKEIGGISPTLWTYYGNDYLCGQAGKLGKHCYYTDKARVVHYERYADKELYSGGDDSEYKGDPAPAAPKMEKDRIRFLRSLRSRPVIWCFKLLRSIQFAIHALAQLKNRNKKNARLMLQTIRQIMSA